MKRFVFRLLGIACFALAIAGFLLPVLPGTPFLLLSAWLFARSSERWHAWLLSSQLFGPVIRDWERNRCIPRRTKIIAVGSMLLAGTGTLVFALDLWSHRILTMGLMIVGAVAVLSIDTCPGAATPAPRHGNRTMTAE